MGTKLDQYEYGPPRVDIVSSQWNPGLPGITQPPQLISYRQRIGTDSTRSVAEAFKKANGYMPVYPYEVVSVVGGCVPGSYEMLAVPGHPTTAGAFIRGVGQRFELVEKASDISNWGFDWNHAAAQPTLMSARANANANVRDQSVSLAEDVAELGQTVRTVSGLIRRIHRSIWHLRAGDLQGAVQQLGFKLIPKRIFKKYDRATWWSTWLAIRYMWIPLLSDIQAAVKLYNDTWAGKPLIVKVRGRASDHWESSPAFVHPQGSKAQIGFTRNIDARYEGKWEVGYIYRITNPSLVLAKAWGITDVASIAWELTTKSFLVDWLVNVGDVIDQFGAWSGCEFLTGWETWQMTEYYSEYASDPVPWSPYFTIGSFTPAFSNWTVYRLRRRVLTSVPPVTLVLQNNLTVKRVIDAIALLAIALGGRRKLASTRRS